MFKFKKHKRELRPGAKVFPAPFSLADAMLLTREPEQEYSSSHNCATLSLRVLQNKSFIWTIFLFSVTSAIALALAPPDYLRKIIRFFYPDKEPSETLFYSKLGFAAGIENIPFEPEEESESDYQEESPHQIPDVDFSLEETFEGLIGEIACIQNNMSEAGFVTLDKEDFEEASELTLINEIMKVELPEDKLLHYVQIPPYQKHSWAQLVDSIHHAISFIRSSRFIDGFIAWMLTIQEQVLDFISPLLESFSYILGLAYNHSKKAFARLFETVCHLLDHIWGLEASKRVKTVWGLTGLYRTGVLGAKARLAASIQYSEFVGRTNFQSDYENYLQELRTFAAKVGATHTKKIGGEQRRPVGFSKPIMSHEEARLLGFSEDEYCSNERYEERISSYRQEGSKQGADGVFLASKMPELIAQSQNRYEPRYPALTSEDRADAREIALAMFNHNPEVFANCDVVTPNDVERYIKSKAKYSPGIPFIGTFKTRQACWDAGYNKVMKQKAEETLKTGKYPVQFYHAFVKSQVVDIQKCLPPEMGGKNKPLRTVVAEDMYNYYREQCCQLERNKRINWDTYGAGIGMPLNQSMEVIFSRMADLQKQRGGRYIIMDATAFDSFCKPFLFEVNSCLWELGFKDHPSGNGKNIASVIRASYDSRQNCWILGVTEPKYDSLQITVENPDLRNRLVQRHSDKMVDLCDLLPVSIRNSNREQIVKFINEKLQPLPGVLSLSPFPEARMKRSNWLGTYKFGNLQDVDKQFFEHHTLTYDPSNFEDMEKDILAIAKSDFGLMSNIHPKNRGGSTGGSDTSNVNTHAFKAGVIWAWCKTTGRRPHEFYEYNDLANTSDDTIWQSGGKHGLNTVRDVEKFRQNCVKVGIHLEIETSKSINDVEYLSKFVRVPTAEDSLSLRKWREQKIRAINASHIARGLPVPESIQELNNPRFVVVQNPTAILLRRSAFRYYQSSAMKWLYPSIERGAGHAMNTAFCPNLYTKFALEWCEDVNILLERQNIHRKYRLVPNGQFGLSSVEQVDPRAGQQSLSPRQKAFIAYLKGHMYPSYYRVIDIHMNVSKIDPELHAKFIKKLEKGWRGWDEILRSGVDGLFAATNAIPDEWSKKFNPGIDMLYAENPFYTKNMLVEKFVYLQLLKETKENEIDFGMFSSRIRESPYAVVCDPYHFWEKLGDPDFKQKLLSEEPIKFKGLVLMISLLYMCTSYAESFILSITMIGSLYMLFLWSFIGMNKVYGILNTMYWHSQGKSSREISRMMPRDPYQTSKRFCAFIIDFVPEAVGFTMAIPCLLLDLLPPLLELTGKTWFKAQEMKTIQAPNSNIENKWVPYIDEWIQKLRASTTRCAYVAAKTSTGKSTFFVAALWQSRHYNKIRKIWLVEPKKILRDETKIPFGIPYQVLQKGIQRSESTDVYICTYGHILNRISEIDEEQDIILFDEFHEEKGEMILGLSRLKARKFLLSATPLPIKSLEGSPFLVPNIDRRHPITIHQYDDSMDVVDAFMEARNRHSDPSLRYMVIVPTHAQAKKVQEQLLWLKIGDVHILSGRNRTIPDTGHIVATPYVQSGLDIKGQPPDILIDSGKDVVIDKGVHISPLPWTDPHVNQQRIGRVGRLRAGVVYQPKSAGTGKRATVYPSPLLFSHKVVADHFDVPQLTAVGKGFSYDYNFLELNRNVLRTLRERKSVALLHALALNGVRQTEWKQKYALFLEGRLLDDDYDKVNQVFDNRRYRKTQLLPWDQALYALYKEDAVFYGINGTKVSRKPMVVNNGKWIELENSPTIHLKFEDVDFSTTESKHNKLLTQLDRFKSGLLLQAKALGDPHLQRVTSVIG